MMARLGGDEFAIILPGIDNPGTAGRVAEHILGVFKAESALSPTAAQVSTSIGIAIFPSDATDRQGLLTNADTALYRAKTDGRDTYRFFEARLGAEVTDRRLLEHELRQAIARKELSLVYQPQKDMRSGEIVGFEALVRWTHPTRGILEAVDFVPIAEESGTILPIGEWALRMACREAASWQQRLVVAVNISPIQLYSTNFARLVHDILVQTGLSPGRLELDITETALLRDMIRALTTLRQLKALGVRIAMDDFGTGASSLSNLRAFPFDKIKIDGSFIKAVDVNEKAAAIVRAVLGLGRGLGLPVLAEGVEGPGELEFLTEESCDEVQGHFLGGPGDIGLYRTITHGSTEPPGGRRALRVVGK
jgi:predicted signal transduction protein with EAL and GGDEF domain